ncbi:MAG: TetR/AcrR family transcriptional regulator [Chloroflexota bacterium]|nr:TetR/AcrR family transcriptional regulator [Chloroflexota bacterium]
MPRPVKPAARAYDAPRRRAAAQRTRRVILEAARRLFVESGYGAITMAEIAAQAGVALDTVYAAVGRKPTLFRLLIESAISGTDEAVPAEQRDYVREIQATPAAAGKLEVYAQSVRVIHARLAPLLRVLQAAAPAEPELADVWREIAERRVRNMRLFAANLGGTGSLREDLSIEEAADVIWATNSAEFYILLVHERGWQPERYEHWLADAWRRLLLRNAGET